MDIKEARAKIATKYLSDAKFREELKKSPNAAIEGLLGIKLPAGMTIDVVYDTPQKTYLVLPARSADGELTEADLGKIAGGAGCWGIMTNEPAPPGGGGGNRCNCTKSA